MLQAATDPLGTDAQNLSDEVLREMTESVSQKHAPSVWLNVIYAWKRRDVSRAARVSLLMWLALIASVLWGLLVLIAVPLAVCLIVTFGSLLISAGWAIPSYLIQVHTYNSPKNGRRLALTGVIPIGLWWLLVCLPAPILFSLLPISVAEPIWMLWGVIAIWGLMIIGLFCPIWMVSLDKGVIRYYLPRMKEERDLRFVQQTHPDDDEIKELRTTFRDLNIPDGLFRMFFDFRGDPSLHDSIRTVIYNHFEKYLFDLREERKKNGQPMDPDLMLDFAFTDDIANDRLKLEQRLRKFGLTEAVDGLHRAEAAFDALLKHIEKPDVLPAPFQWIATLDDSHPTWVNGKYAAVNAWLPGLAIKGGGRFDLEVSFLLAFKPQAVRLPWSRRNIAHFESVDEVEKYLSRLFARATERVSKNFFVDYDLSTAITHVVYNEYLQALGSNLLFFIARTCGAEIQNWSINLSHSVDEYTQKELDALQLKQMQDQQAAEAQNAELRVFIDMLHQQTDLHITPQLILHLRAQQKLPNFLRTIPASYWGFESYVSEDNHQQGDGEVEPKPSQIDTAQSEQAPPPDAAKTPPPPMPSTMPETPKEIPQTQQGKNKSEEDTKLKEAKARLQARRVQRDFEDM